MLKKFAMLVVAMSFAGLAFASGEHSAQGTVNAVNAGENKINISHGPIKSAGMDAMTMDFLVEDPAMLEDVKKGSTINFSVMKDSKGMFVITDLEVTGTSTAKAADDGHNHNH